MLEQQAAITAPVPSGSVPTGKNDSIIQFIVRTGMVTCPFQTLLTGLQLPLKMKEF